jgi:hypothetical protein
VFGNEVLLAPAVRSAITDSKLSVTGADHAATKLLRAQIALLAKGGTFVIEVRANP